MTQYCDYNVVSQDARGFHEETDSALLLGNIDHCPRFPHPIVLIPRLLSALYEKY